MSTPARRDPFDPLAVDRFIELRGFARSIGACLSCATWLAMKQIDKEFAFTSPPGPAICAHGDSRCVEAARGRWKEMPKAPQPAPVAKPKAA